MSERIDTCIAVVLAAGQGKRMGTKVQKQFLEINEKPILCYSLEVFERTEFIDKILLVTSSGMEEYCKNEIVEKYHFHKVFKIISGGKERYDSVYCALKQLETENVYSKEHTYIFIHDGARPFVTGEMLERSYSSVKDHFACVAAVPEKNTIKIADDEGFVQDTPQRNRVWSIQTPQVFRFDVVWEAYDALMKSGKTDGVTDDAMVVEKMKGLRVKLVEGDYRNIKITTPEDLEIAEIFAKK